MNPNEFVETLTFQENDSDNELRQDVNLNIFLCYQDRKAKYWISWWVGFFCLTKSELYLQELLNSQVEQTRSLNHTTNAYLYNSIEFTA